MGLFQDLFTNKPAADAARRYADGVNAGKTESFGILTGGRDAGLGAIEGGRAGALMSLMGADNRQALDAYYDAAGVTGAPGMARAAATFRASPGYQAGLEGGLDAIDRRAAARGMLASGSTNLDTARFATDYADSMYGNFASRLAQAAGLEMGRAVPAAQAYLTTGAQEAGLHSGTAQQMAQTAFGAGTAIGNANSQAEMARGTAAQNALGAINTGINLAGRMFGMM